MASIPFWPAVAGAVVLLLVVLVLKLRGSGGRDDLINPRRRRGKRISPGEAGRLLELVEARDEEGALRMIREHGYDEAEARKILALVVKFVNYVKPDRGCGAHLGERIIFLTCHSLSVHRIHLRLILVKVP